MRDLTAPDVDGADAVVDWFGRWPTFGDAEILSLHINRSATSSLRVWAFIPSAEVDSNGFYIRERPRVVRFEFTGIQAIDIRGEDADVQNVVASLDIERVPDGYKLGFDSHYGIAGELVVRQLRVVLEAN